LSVIPASGTPIKAVADDSGQIFLNGQVAGNATIEVTSPTHGTSRVKVNFPADPGMALVLHWENAQVRPEFVAATAIPTESSPAISKTPLTTSLGRVMRTRTGVADPLQPPPGGLRGAGDECVSATPIACGDTDQVIVLGGGFTGNTNGATPGDPVSSCEIGVGGPFTHDASWWYDFTLAAASDVNITMCGSDLAQDCVIGLVDDCNNLTELGCGEDECDFPNFSPPNFTVNALPAGNYKLVIQAYSGGYDPAIPFEITINCTPLGPPPYGACCDDLTGVCEDCVQGDCPPPSRFTANTTCADIDPACGQVTGACCDPILGGCTDATPMACAASGGIYSGNFTSCLTFVCPCVVNCPPGSVAENEPDCGPEYEDVTNGGCNSPVQTGSSCCFPQGGPGCDDPTCEATVCGLDPFCCNVAWDGICADEAADFCGTLCDNITTDFPYFGTVACGETICGEGGTYTAGGLDLRDTDWYKIVLTQATQVTWTVEAEFPVVAGIVDTGGIDDCTLVSAFLVSALGGECEEIQVTECLGAGTWYLFVAPSVFDSVDCGREYTARMDCDTCPSGACCLGNGSCVADQTPGQCAGQGGVFQGDGSSCTPNPCPQPQPGDNCTDAIPLTCGGSHSVTVLGSGYTGNSNGASPQDPVTSCEIGVGGPFTHDASWWYDLTIPAESSVTVSMCTSDLAQDAVLGLFDDCGSPMELGCGEDECDFPNFSPPEMVIPSLPAGNYKLNVQAYTGGYNAAVPFNITVTCGAPSTGACCVAGVCTATNGLGDCNGLGGDWFINETCPAFAGCPQPITNETCGSAITIDPMSLPFSIQQDNNDALSGAPAGSCNAGGTTVMQNDIWYSFTPPVNCDATLSVDYSLDQGSNYDGITVISSGSCGSLTELQCLDSSFGGADSDNTLFAAQAGVTYYFQVGDWGSGEQGGPTQVNFDCVAGALGACCAPNGTCTETSPGGCVGVGTYQGNGTDCTPNNCPQPPANDNCTTAEALPVPGSDTESNVLATDDAISGGSCGTASALNQAVWYAVTGNGTTLTVSTCGGATHDTQIQVWCNSCASPVCVGGSDDFCGLQSEVSWCSGVGTTYYVAVGGFGSATGSATLTATSGAACGSPPNCAPQYCAPGGPSSSADSLCNTVVFNTINNVSGNVCATYTDFTGISTTVNQGSMYPVSVTSGTCAGCFGKWTKVFIDWNQDLDFNDLGEEAYTSGASSVGCPHTFNGNITIPGSATLGATRMRVVVREGGTQANTLGCGNVGFTWGEVEDYTVVVAPPSPPLGGPPFDDDDMDGVPNFCDNCPDDANADQADADMDGVGDPCDQCVGFDDNADADGDGVADGCDECPGFDDNADNDGDGTADGCDGCPLDPGKIHPGVCGCGTPDTDTDGDGTPDCIDGCPDDPNKTDPEICGCGVSETGDSDGDGVLDCVDQCPGVDDAVFFPGCVGAIPTMSSWGLIVLALLLLVLSKVYYGRRPVTA
jgi:hypothetical protein